MSELHHSSPSLLASLPYLLPRNHPFLWSQPLPLHNSLLPLSSMLEFHIWPENLLCMFFYLFV
jgi:hypothetical protein